MSAKMSFPGNLLLNSEIHFSPSCLIRGVPASIMSIYTATLFKSSIAASRDGRSTAIWSCGANCDFIIVYKLVCGKNLPALFEVRMPSKKLFSAQAALSPQHEKQTLEEKENRLLEQ